MNIKIIADSTCDLSPALLDQHNITLVPLTVVKNGQEFKDNVSITPAEIFAHVAAGGALCSTAANNVSLGEVALLMMSGRADALNAAQAPCCFLSCFGVHIVCVLVVIVIK